MFTTRDLKYLLAYVLPASAFWAVSQGGLASYSALFVGFGALPALELILPVSTRNPAVEEEAPRSRLLIFDLLLYLNLPLLYLLVCYFLSTVHQGGLAPWEITGMTLSVGLVIGTSGINVGHELGHRHTAYERAMAKALLLPGFYMHFIIEHNLGHHKHVATPEDPATARRGEPIYRFLLRSAWGAYRNAWRLERSRLNRAGQPFWSINNEMLRFTAIELGYLLLAGWAYGPAAAALALGAGVFGFLMLESVNYIEHYGLVRRKLPNGKYERVTPAHSWNSDHELGRIFLYELTRHSDHHYKATRKYQILRRHEESPKLPTGYPGAILLALVPPAWYRVMHPRLPRQQG
ncbi:alkane 1-monooxygenase [Phaeodactylibacter luteus]|uniref:Alkane 1-monooxygenase n=1 Tax=Phaeodactylibacter luteus TaxID=1564516 RepID=A0A5C6RNI0_9BACT|nr:alkane 1-monooxygenase [Phaeodactylibacter luteus]TXB63190.1 alkane 1-monooxygenase [Phaeodactylibacter luteus]